MLDILVAIVGVAASLVALTTALRYYLHVRHEQSGLSWVWMLGGMVCITLAEIVDATVLSPVNLRVYNSDILSILAEIALAIGFVRLFNNDLVAERARLKRAEALSNATRQLSASLELDAVLKAIAQEALEMVAVDEVAVVPTDPQAGALPDQLAFAGRETGCTGVHRNLPSELTRQILSSGQPQFISDMSRHPLQATAQFPCQSSLAALPLLHGGQVKGFLYAVCKKPHQFSPDERQILVLFAQHAALAIHNAQLHRQVEQLSVTDPLTGLANRRRFDRELADELTRARRYAKPLSLILCDIDLFKTVNDRLGHPAGDAALRAMGEVLRQTVRETDLPTRVGGEEFAVLMPETGPDEALEVAERLRSGVENRAVEWEGQTFRLTISVGVTGSAGEALPDTPDELYRLADGAMYRAKEAGRNRVVAAPFAAIRARAAS